jgi:hypothetical protein
VLVSAGHPSAAASLEQKQADTGGYERQRKEQKVYGLGS